MNLNEILLRSLAIGALASACMVLCPRAWRGRARRAVPVAAFTALLLLPLCSLVPVEVETTAPTPILAAVAQETPRWMTALWLTGAALCIARLAFGAVAVRSIIKNTRSAAQDRVRLLDECRRSLGIRGAVRLRIASAGFIPSATGLFRRTVILPAESATWTESQLRLVMLHELGHFRRGDLWTHALGRLVCALHWFNPFAWVLQRQLAIEREYAVDELVVENGVEPADYATLLWQLASDSRAAAATTPAVGLAMAQREPGKLEARVRRILAPVKKAGAFLRLTDAAACTSAVLLLFACAACKPILAGNAPGPDRAEIELRLSAQSFPGDAE